MPVADSLVGRFQGGDNYGLLEKGFWSREARKKNAAEAYAAAAAAQETADQTRSSNEAQLTKERDERLHGFDMSRMDESYKRQLANRLEELSGVGALAQGNIIKNQAEIDRIAHADLMKVAPEIARNQAVSKLGESVAERARREAFAKRAGAMTDAELDATMAKLREGKVTSEYNAEDPGRDHKLEAAKALIGAQTAKDIAGVRSETDKYEADRRAGKGASTKLPITAAESKPGTGIIDLNKLKGMSGPKLAPDSAAAPNGFSAEQVQALQEVLPFVMQLFKGGAAAPK